MAIGLGGWQAEVEVPRPSLVLTQTVKPPTSTRNVEVGWHATRRPRIVRS